MKICMLVASFGHLVYCTSTSTSVPVDRWISVVFNNGILHSTSRCHELSLLLELKINFRLTTFHYRPGHLPIDNFTFHNVLSGGKQICMSCRTPLWEHYKEAEDTRVGVGLVDEVSCRWKEAVL